MKFLILFIALLLQQQLPRARRWGQGDLYGRWLGLWQRWAGFERQGARTRFLLLVILPSILVTLLFIWLESFAWGLLAAIAEIGLLLLVLFQANVGGGLKRYREHLAHGDVQGAFLCAEETVSVPGVGLSADAESLNAQVLHTVQYRWFEYFFLMVFWYMFADVGGVVLAWLTLHFVRAQEAAALMAEDDVPQTTAADCQQGEESEGQTACIARWCLHWLEWAPARLLGLTYCLAGNMTVALPVWRQLLWKTAIDSQQVLADVASAALSFSHDGKRCWHSAAADCAAAAAEVDEWQRLHFRSMSVWMVGIAVATIGGWLL
ncbi:MULTISPECIES: regulatory signaling modulator protein AmpE [unclassified Oceanobacter]|uniref:regulatory signaling modulator protein AmpE n=1 Tax=unclassified Oceanobacter TaxID=2620260 RepID=UPI0026E23531|nr:MULTISPECIES: regulatory signaling modulator protein AmpE [unclassified Oceanobacter]MDO6681759.1 regulatory signaling modulator protein AmpE [Oceanobacter sp. 5_MG-2023]MDP2506230.1 regulatory signaling modulator protein AmpE [Oceanobacter sp. 3_MG-2023]MDP2546508.1 regulatory signaling modulator protein AmpE [Oceanobacter sp. 4_MG-2023]MDP2609704.1 regulatory signaling modulator protein AmpE [Oceanobacter sp. 1_MG-2023]MDP2613857.1 regulatory signaling modulator protein AmpE [Oceanobacter